jgi:uncharacterized protein
MTEQELLKHQKWCKQRWNGNGDDVFQEAYLIAIKRYGDITRINQSLFGLLCLEAAREIQKHERYEIPFSCLAQENEDREEFAEFDFTDPTWKRQYIAIEEREEVAKTYGQWLLNALLKATTEPPKNMVTTDRTIYEKQMKFEFV